MCLSGTTCMRNECLSTSNVHWHIWQAHNRTLLVLIENWGSCEDGHTCNIKDGKNCHNCKLNLIGHDIVQDNLKRQVVVQQLTDAGHLSFLSRRVISSICSRFLHKFSSILWGGEALISVISAAFPACTKINPLHQYALRKHLQQDSGRPLIANYSITNLVIVPTLPELLFYALCH